MQDHIVLGSRIIFVFVFGNKNTMAHLCGVTDVTRKTRPNFKYSCNLPVLNFGENFYF